MKKALQVVWRGLRVEIPADDPRAEAIVSMLFDPSEPAPPPPPEPPPSEAAMRFWDDLEPLERRELLTLAEKARAPTELEGALGVKAGGLAALHRQIGNCARARGVEIPILSRGRGRAHRRFHLQEETAALVRRLASLPPLC